MRTKPFKPFPFVQSLDRGNPQRRLRASEQGLSFVESLVATVVFTVGMLTIGSAFLGQQMVTLAAAAKSGASVAAQQVTDELRRTPITEMPSTGTVVINNEATSPRIVNGYKYGTQITYCPAGHVVCNSRTRQIRIEVKLTGKTIYAVDTVYTDLQAPTEG